MGSLRLENSWGTSAGCKNSSGLFGRLENSWGNCSAGWKTVGELSCWLENSSGLFGRLENSSGTVREQFGETVRGNCPSWQAREQFGNCSAGLSSGTVRDCSGLFGTVRNCSKTVREQFGKTVRGTVWQVRNSSGKSAPLALRKIAPLAFKIAPETAPLALKMP